MKFENEKIILDKVLNNLDKFMLDFIKVLEKHTDYVLVSGYVSILFGRSRISEDIDLLIPELSKGEFKRLYQSLLNDFYCINNEKIDELFDMLVSKRAIRFARKGKVIPNMEVKFADNIIAKHALKNKLEVQLGKKSIFISPIELQIAYKEMALGSPKDKEDALHLREVFKDHISSEKIKYYERLLKQHA